MRRSVLFLSVLVPVITFTSVPVAVAQERSRVAQDAPKEAVPAVAPTKVPAADHKNLIGEWKGTWGLLAGGGGDLYLTIKSVQDGKVVGSVYVYSRARYAHRDLPITGTVTPEGALSLANEYLDLSFTEISTKEMSGRGVADGVYRVTIDLRKVK